MRISYNTAISANSEYLTDIWLCADTSSEQRYIGRLWDMVRRDVVHGVDEGLSRPDNPMVKFARDSQLPVPKFVGGPLDGREVPVASRSLYRIHSARGVVIDSGEFDDLDNEIHDSMSDRLSKMFPGLVTYCCAGLGRDYYYLGL
jgi:hypothetical protein